jgi:hypothetical protein
MSGLCSIVFLAINADEGYCSGLKSLNGGFGCDSGVRLLVDSSEDLSDESPVASPFASWRSACGRFVHRLGVRIATAHRVLREPQRPNVCLTEVLEVNQEKLVAPCALRASAH